MKKYKAILVAVFSTACLLAVHIAAAELSMTSTWRIEQASATCKQTDNLLTYSDYWGEGVTDENIETVCIAEQFATLVKEDGQDWLDQGSGDFIDKCKEASGDSQTKYHACIKTGLMNVVDKVSAPCQEMGEEGLWDEQLCRSLISYIFIEDFQGIMEARRPILERLAEHKRLKILFGPIAAIIVLLLYVLDVVLWTDPGNWMRIPKFGFVVGTVIMVALFLPEPWNFAATAAGVCVCLAGIVFNHIVDLFASKRKKKVSPKF